MNNVQIVVALMSLAIFFFAIALSGLCSIVRSIRAQTWISTLSMCACFWSIVAAVIVGLSS